MKLQKNLKKEEKNKYLLAIILLNILLMISLFYAYSLGTKADKHCDQRYSELIDYYNQHNTNNYHNLNLIPTNTQANNNTGLYKELMINGSLSKETYLYEEIE